MEDYLHYNNDSVTVFDTFDGQETLYKLYYAKKFDSELCKR